MMKKKKRRINTFKNWLLARDSSSRISTVPSYRGFFESDKDDEDKKDKLDLFFRSPRSNR